MKFQIYLFISAAIFTVAVADTLLRSQNVNHENGVKEVPKHFTKEEIAKFRETIKDHKKKIAEKSKMTVFFDEDSDGVDGLPGQKQISQRDTLLRSFHSNIEQVPDKHIEKRDTLLKALPVKHREDKRGVAITFKNGESSGSDHAEPLNKHVEKRDTLLRNGVAPESTMKYREDKKVIITFKDTLLRSLQSGDKRAKRDTLLRNGAIVETDNEDRLPRHREDRRKVSVTFKDTLLRSLNNGDKRDKRDTLLRSLPTGEKRAPQRDALLNALRERYSHMKTPSQRDTLLKNLATYDKTLGTQNITVLDARRREAISNFLKNRKNRNPAQVAQRDTLLRSGDWPGFPRKKRDIAATVVGAAISSVVSNLMKNVEESVVKAENDAKKLQSDVLDSDQGSIMGQGVVAPISSDVFGHVVPNRPAAPISNEAVPLPFVPVKAHDAPKSNDLVPKPFAPIHADVEVIVGNNATTSTSAPAADKKGFFATLFNSFKLLFGTVTNSVGGFFIDVGSRITNFVEKRIKV